MPSTADLQARIYPLPHLGTLEKHLLKINDQYFDLCFLDVDQWRAIKGKPLQSFFEKSGVWGFKPQRGPGAEPLAFFSSLPKQVCPRCHEGESKWKSNA
jgi:hypothetical protein